MNVTIKLFATFRNERFKVVQKGLTMGTDCSTIVHGLGLTETEIGVVMVNGRHASLAYVLQDGDTLSLFPLVGGG